MLVQEDKMPLMQHEEVVVAVDENLAGSCVYIISKPRRRPRDSRGQYWAAFVVRVGLPEN